MRGYRGIHPVPTFDSNLHPLRRRQFHWVEQSEGLETATFAGKEMMLCQNDDGSYQLTYLDMAAPTAFQTAAAAKEASFDFARAVLLTMLGHLGVRDEDNSLQRCLLAGGE